MSRTPPQAVLSTLKRASATFEIGGARWWALFLTSLRQCVARFASRCSRSPRTATPLATIADCAGTKHTRLRCAYVLALIGSALGRMPGSLSKAQCYTLLSLSRISLRRLRARAAAVLSLRGAARAALARRMVVGMFAACALLESRRARGGRSHHLEVPDAMATCALGVECRVSGATPPPTPLEPPATPSPQKTASTEREEASKVLDWIYIGGAEAAANCKSLEERGIRHILNCCERIPFASECTRNQQLRMRDLPTEQLSTHLPSAFVFLDETKSSGGRCLVHCRSGASRSVAVVLAYLVMRERMRLSDAWVLVHTQRPVARPNRGFVEQLIDLDRVVHGPSAAAAPFDFAARARGGQRPDQRARGKRPGVKRTVSRCQPPSCSSPFLLMTTSSGFSTADGELH